MTPLTAFIYGSCVSRDLVRIDDERFTAGYYLARQSWISAFAEGRRAPDLPITSAFQKRMVEGDFQSSGKMILASTRPGNADVILLDLIDERLGVVPYSGSWITWSNELRKSGALPGAESELVAFGSDRHFGMWREAAGSVKNALLPHLSKTFVLAARFADVTDGGRPLAPFRGISSADWNRHLERYYSTLSDIGFQLIEQSDEHVIANESHKWGATPFHYPDDAYLSMGDAIIRTRTA